MTLAEYAVLFSDITAFWYMLGVPVAVVVGLAGYYALPTQRLPYLWLWSLFLIGFFEFCGNHHRMMSGHLEAGTMVMTGAMVLNDGLMALTTTIAGGWVWWMIGGFLLRSYPKGESR